MTSTDDPEFRRLEQAAAGDELAREAILSQHRELLCRMIRLRLDPRLTPRLDPSDLVQDALIVASNRLEVYLRDRPAPFLVWLRQIALDRLADAYRRHVRADCRTVTREVPMGALLPDDSVEVLARRLASNGTSPSRRLDQIDRTDRVRLGLARLSDSDREILVMRYVEGRSISEIAMVLQIGEGAVKMRQLRALERFRTVIGPMDPWEDTRS